MGPLHELIGMIRSPAAPAATDGVEPRNEIEAGIVLHKEIWSRLHQARGTEPRGDGPYSKGIVRSAGGWYSG